MPAVTDRTVRFIDVEAADSSNVANGIEDMYNDALDVIVARGAFSRDVLAAAGELLDRDDRNPGWNRPNERMPVEDIQLLGTDTPATPTYQAPTGASLDAYLDSAEKHHEEADRVFDRGFDATREITAALKAFAGGRPVEVPKASDGRTYLPYTVRRLVN